MNHYPIVAYPWVKLFVNRADVYLSAKQDQIINNKYKYGLLEAERIFPLTIGANLPKPFPLRHR